MPEQLRHMCFYLANTPLSLVALHPSSLSVLAVGFLAVLSHLPLVFCSTVRKLKRPNS